MLIFDRRFRAKHQYAFYAFVAATVVASLGYLACGFSSGQWTWPAGSSGLGFSYGVIGGVIIVFEVLLAPRKVWRGKRWGPTKFWMAAHLWLGLFTLPILLLHGSFHFNFLSASPLAAILMWLLVIVVASGVYGAYLQNDMPRRMLEELPTETITSQIPRVLEEYRKEAKRLVDEVCGPLPGEEYMGPEFEPTTLGAVQTSVQSGRVQGKVIEPGLKVKYVPESKALRAFYNTHVKPYLESSAVNHLKMASARGAAGLFESIERELPKDARPVVARLSYLCDERRQFDLQVRYHNRLFTWLGFHVPLSIALLILMVVHIILAFMYV